MSPRVREKYKKPPSRILPKPLLNTIPDCPSRSKADGSKNEPSQYPIRQKSYHNLHLSGDCHNSIKHNALQVPLATSVLHLHLRILMVPVLSAAVLGSTE